jgi:tetratricopeptide (TPR) repeat protein
MDERGESGTRAARGWRWVSSRGPGGRGAGTAWRRLGWWRWPAVGLGLVAVWAVVAGGCGLLVDRALDQRRLVTAANWERWGTVARLGWVDWSTRVTLWRKLGRFNEVDRHREEILAAGLTRRRLDHEQLLVLAQAGGLENPEASLAEVISGDIVAGREIFEAFTNGAIANYQIEEATYLLDNWDRDYPHDPLPCLLRGRIAEHRNAWDESVQQYEAALKRNSGYGPAAYNLARVRLGQTKLAEARAAYEQSAGLLELPHPAWVGLAHCLRLTGDLDGAGRWLDKALAADVDTRVLAYRLVGDTADSARASASMERAELSLARKQPIPALRDFEAALVEQPMNSAIRFHYAAALRQAGKTAEAEREYERVKAARSALAGLTRTLERVRERPDDPAPRTELGLLFLQYIAPQQGVVWLQSALRVDPDYQPAHAALASHYALTAGSSPDAERLQRYHADRASGGR